MDLAHRAEALDHALQYGRGLDRSNADRFVGMYVNDLTLQYGERGRAAVQRLMDEAWAKRLIPQAGDRRVQLLTRRRPLAGRRGGVDVSSRPI